jgi:hypothetical protein
VLLVAAIVVAFIGGIILLQLNETPDERNARAESEFKTERSVNRKRLIEEQENYLTIACAQSKNSCDKAKQDVQRQNCEMFREGCTRKPNLGSASSPTIR